MALEESYLNERLEHLGIVAGVCQEIGLAAWLCAQDPDHRQLYGYGPHDRLIHATSWRSNQTNIES